MTTGKSARRRPLATRAREEQLALLFKALGDLNRLRVLAALLAGESSVGKIAMATGLPRATVSRAVSLFLRHDLLIRGRSGGALQPGHGAPAATGRCSRRTPDRYTAAGTVTACGGSCLRSRPAGSSRSRLKAGGPLGRLASRFAQKR
ncbi:MAG: ArsR/SmtB family transcription factor [bacterium]